MYHSIYPKVKTFITNNSGSVDDAFDVFQDSIVIFCRYVQQNKFDRKKEVSGFLYAISRNLWINKVKKESRITRIAENEEITDFGDFTNDIITNEKARALKQITNLLGEKCFKLLRYSVYYKNSSDEIRESMGFSTANAVKTQKYKCKQKLLNILKENPSFNEIIE